jgi:chromosomal replication initiation ATPase DnaA
MGFQEQAQSRYPILNQMPTFEDILNAVATNRNVCKKDILDSVRLKHISLVRHEVAWLARNFLAKNSYRTIGGYMRRNHDTVLHSYKVFDAALAAGTVKM